jgi:hypothetical protein
MDDGSLYELNGRTYVVRVLNTTRTVRRLIVGIEERVTAEEAMRVRRFAKPVKPQNEPYAEERICPTCNGSGHGPFDVGPACLSAMASNEPRKPDDTLKRCTICGFVVDTKFEAEKPTSRNPGRRD